MEVSLSFYFCKMGNDDNFCFSVCISIEREMWWQLRGMACLTRLFFEHFLHFTNLPNAWCCKAKNNIHNNHAIWRRGAPVLLFPPRTRVLGYKRGAAFYAVWQNGKGRHLQNLNPEAFLTEIMRVSVLLSQHKESTFPILQLIWFMQIAYSLKYI